MESFEFVMEIHVNYSVYTNIFVFRCYCCFFLFIYSCPELYVVKRTSPQCRNTFLTISITFLSLYFLHSLCCRSFSFSFSLFHSTVGFFSVFIHLIVSNTKSTNQYSRMRMIGWLVLAWTGESFTLKIHIIIHNSGFDVLLNSRK